jgi:hypothetical protein
MVKLFCASLCLLAGLCFAGTEPSSKFVFHDLDGVAHQPLDPGDKLASVLVFYWQDCPISNGYAPELNRIAAGHTNVALYIVQVDPELTPEAAREHARKFGLRPPVLLDPQHRLVKRLNATVTPEAIVLGKRGEVLYRGRIDDGYVALGKKRATVTEHDLIDTLNAVAAGKPAKKTETKAIGCSIQ